MIIANPIYDVVFKFLMEDERIAKFFIGTLLEETIEEIAMRPQEITHRIPGDAGEGITVFRLDFVATVKTAKGEFKKVLVEIQKARNEVDLMRFRNYLGEQYKRQDEVHGKMMTLPITTIYLLGFNLPEIDASVVRVNREYTDLLSHQVIAHKSEFIEQLSHDCHVVQLKRIKGKVQTKLERLLRPRSLADRRRDLRYLGRGGGRGSVGPHSLPQDKVRVSGHAGGRPCGHDRAAAPVVVHHSVNKLAQHQRASERQQRKQRVVLGYSLVIDPYKTREAPMEIEESDQAKNARLGEGKPE